MTTRSVRLPNRLGHFEVLKHLGRGSMGDVFLCYDPALDRKMVVKRMHEAHKSSFELLERFAREARLIAQARHPSVVHIYEFWKEDGFLHIAMEYVEGFTLREILDRCHALPPDIAALLYWDLLVGLRTLHRMGVVHRDIKPANIMVSRFGQAKLLDFGVAHLGGSADLTIPGTVVGTTAYMSPEQGQGLTVDARSDLFSLAVTLAEAISGTHPFRDKDPAQTLENILHHRPHRLRGKFGPVPSYLRRALSMSLEKKTLRRPSDVDAVLQRMANGMRRLPRDHQTQFERLVEDVRMGHDLEARNYNLQPSRWLFRTTGILLLLISALVAGLLGNCGPDLHAVMERLTAHFDGAQPLSP